MELEGGKRGAGAQEGGAQVAAGLAREMRPLVRLELGCQQRTVSRAESGEEGASGVRMSTRAGAASRSSVETTTGSPLALRPRRCT